VTRSFLGFLDVLRLLFDRRAPLDRGFRLRFFIGLSCYNRRDNFLLNFFLLSIFLLLLFLSIFLNNFSWLCYVNHWCFRFFLFLFSRYSGWLFSIYQRLKSWKIIINLQFFQSISSFLFFLEKTLHSRLTLLRGFISWIDFVPKYFLSRYKLPVSISVFEHLVVSIGHNVNVQLSTKHHIFVHSFAGNFSYFFLSKLEERIAFGSPCLFAPGNAQFRYIAELLEELA